MSNNDWSSSEELIDFFRVSPAPTYEEAMHALQFTSFSSEMFNHMAVFVIDGDIDNPLMFFAWVGTDKREHEAVIVHITDKQMSERMAHIASWTVSDIAGAPTMKAYTAQARMVHYLRLSFIDGVEIVTFEELSRRYDRRLLDRKKTQRPRVSVHYRRRSGTF